MKRFGKVAVLTAKTPVLGATAGKWDKALTGNMRQTLAEVKAPRGERHQAGRFASDVDRCR